jgi:hypothetical protein
MAWDTSCRDWSDRLRSGRSLVPDLPLDQDAARKALYAKIAPSIVTVTSYLKVPPGTLLEGKWKIADESPYKGYMRQQVASGILLDDTGLVLCCRSPLALDDGSFAPIVDIETSSGYRFDAELIASEPTINLALVQIKCHPFVFMIGDARIDKHGGLGDGQQSIFLCRDGGAGMIM